MSDSESSSDIDSEDSSSDEDVSSDESGDEQEVDDEAGIIEQLEQVDVDPDMGQIDLDGTHVGAGLAKRKHRRTPRVMPQDDDGAMFKGKRWSLKAIQWVLFIAEKHITREQYQQILREGKWVRHQKGRAAELMWDDLHRSINAAMDADDERLGPQGLKRFDRDAESWKATIRMYMVRRICEGHVNWRDRRKGDDAQRKTEALAKLFELLDAGARVQGDEGDGNGVLGFHGITDARALSHDVNAECIKLGIKSDAAIWRRLVREYPSLYMTLEPIKRFRDEELTRVRRPTSMRVLLLGLQTCFLLWHLWQCHCAAWVCRGWP